MKKILAMLAVVSFASSALADWDKEVADAKSEADKIESADATVAYPFKPFVGTFVSPVGTTIWYAIEGADLIADGVKAEKAAMVAAAGCLDKAEHPGQTTACLVKGTGDTVIVVWNTAGYEVANATDMLGKILTRVSGRWSDAAGVMAAEFEKNGMVIGQGATLVVKFVIDQFGILVDATATTVTQGIQQFTDGVALATNEFVNIPVSLLNNLNVKAAGDSFTIGVGYSLCTVIDLALLPVQLVVEIANREDQGNRPMYKCLKGMRTTADEIRAGTYKSQPAPYGYDNKP